MPADVGTPLPSQKSSHSYQLIRGLRRRKCCVNSWHGSIASTESDCKESHAQAVVAAEWCVRDQQHAIGRRICADKGTVIYFMSWNE